MIRTSPMSDAMRDFAEQLVRRLQDAGYVALWAGGCVRDLLLGRVPKDYDVATDARPEQVRELFGRRRTRSVGASFGVILVHGPRGVGSVEVATFRTEGPYSDSRRPDHVAFATPEEDAHRRDFTINGMFYDPVEARVLDYVGGEADLGRGIVRAIGDPRDRMHEDKLRLLRAVRFTAMLDFELDAATADAVREMSPRIHLVSAERIAHELKRMLVDPHRMRAVHLTRELGLLGETIPELLPAFGRSPDEIPAAGARTLRMLQLLDEPGFELAFAVLLETAPSEASRICTRLRLSNQETDHIVWLLANRDALDAAPHLPLARLKRLMSHPLFGNLLRFERVRLLAAGTDLDPVLFCEEFLHKTPPEEIDPPPLVRGTDLIARGFQPGPDFKRILDAVRDAQLEGDITDFDEAIDLAKRLATQ